MKLTRNALRAIMRDLQNGSRSQGKEAKDKGQRDKGMYHLGYQAALRDMGRKIDALRDGE